MEITVTFHQLQVQFIRCHTIACQRLGRKVANVDIVDLWTKVTLGDQQIIEGYLGGLHVLDLTPEDILHREVLSVGVDVLEMTKSRPQGVFHDYDSGGDEAKKAFSFTLLKPKGYVDDAYLSSHDESLSNRIRLSLHMASAHYTHTYRFISELSLCINDFSSHANAMATSRANAMAQSLRSVATSMAISLVTKQKSLADGIDYFSSSFSHGASAAPLESRTSSRRPSVESCDEMAERNVESITSVQVEGKRRVYVHVTIETPVIILPRTSSSRERLVAHLGRIVVYNTHLTDYGKDVQKECRKSNSFSNFPVDQMKENNLEDLDEFNDVDRVYIDITDMSLYSLGFKNADVNDDVSEHILHNTAVRLVVDRCCKTLHDGERMGTSRKPTIHVSGRVTQPLSLVLSSRAYQQLLSTSDILSGKTERDLNVSKGASVSSSVMTPPLISPM